VSTEPKPKLKQKAPTATFSYRGGEDDDDDNRPADGPKVGDRIEVRAPPGGAPHAACAVVCARASLALTPDMWNVVECGERCAPRVWPW
jgi:hypothetical protein